MACDNFSEAAELSRAEEAIVDILTQFYLEDLEFRTAEQNEDNWEITTAESTLEKSGEVLVFQETDITNSNKINEPRSIDHKSGYGTIYYYLKQKRYLIVGGS